MKEYIQPEVELVQFTSESVTTTTNPGSGVGGSVSNVFDGSDIVIPGQP